MAVDATAEQKNFVFRSFMMLSPLKESVTFNLDAFDALLDQQEHHSFADNLSAINPLTLKYGGVKSVLRFIRYFQERKIPIFNDDVLPKFYLVVEPRDAEDFMAVS